MSRAQVYDNSATVSMFPFLAVLLCTMGALIVVLVCVTQLSRASALQQAAAEEAAAEEAAAAAPPDAERIRQEFERVTAFAAKLDELRERAEQQLDEDQSRLGHLEDHMRRLQDEIESLHLAAAEINALEEEHYSDREQAERELARLDELIADRQQLIEELREENQARPPSYAILPYEGKNGSRRPPIYIECRPDEVILQPEGIRFTDADFVGPPGFGSPLAAALRAAREYAVSKDPNAFDDIVEPYPLILIRPHSHIVAALVEDVIQSSGMDFGYEIVDGDWNLKFPPPNPQLASIEQQAVELARTRLKVLASAAPRAFHSGSRFGGGFSRFGGFGRFTGGYDDGFGDGFGDGDFPGRYPGTEFAVESTAGDHVGSTGDYSHGSGGHGNGDQESPLGARLATDGTSTGSQNGDGPDAGSSDGTTGGGEDADDGSPGMPGESNGGPPGQVGAVASHGESSEASAAGGTGGSPGAASTPQAGSPASTSSALAAGAVGESADAPTLSAANVQINQPEADPTDGRSNQARRHTRGKNWAMLRGGPGSVPIRRTIQIIVRGDRLAILPERQSTNELTIGGHEVPLTGPTLAAFDDFMSELHAHIEQWGIAGQGLHWRPVLKLNVAPDGRRRANDLTRLLKNTGLEIQIPSVANQNQGSEAGATR